MTCSRFPALCRLALLLAVPLWLAGPPASALEATPALLFPRPAELERDVQFWLRVYTEVGTDGGFIHDSRNLGVVYEVVHFPNGASSRSRDRIVEQAKQRYRDNLRRLAKGSRSRSELGSTQSRILDLWDEPVSDRTLRDASKHVRFQLGQADKFRAGLIRSGAWRDYIRKTFTDMGLPVELAALPHVESSFTAHAYSRVGAAGLWQFTHSTGRRYMRVDHVVDERLEPLIATISAARLLEHNYRATGSWPLALTAYNHGAAGMRRASRKMGTKDIEVIARKYRSRTFGFASRNFYVEFLAALEVDQNPEKYFGELLFDSPPSIATIELPYYASAAGLAKALDIDKPTLQKANPALRTSVWNGAKRIPKGFMLQVPREHLAQPLETRIEAVPDSARFAKQTRDSFHKVRRGETLSAIARRYGVSMRELSSLNGLRSRHRIGIGQKLRLPEAAGSRRSRPTKVAAATPQAPPTDGVYTVHRGDNLAQIAERFRVSERDLLNWNSVRNRHRIQVGQRLRVSAPSAAAPSPAAAPSRAAASVSRTAEVPPEANATAQTTSLGKHPDSSSEFTPPPSTPAEFDRTLTASAAPSAAAESVADAAAAERAAGGESPDALLADPSDYSVSADGTLEIQATETLGHYAEWLDVRASRLRSLNNMRYGTPLALGERVRLDLSVVTPHVFEQRRADHHRALQGEFFERYAIDGTTMHKVRRGDSVWQLAERKYDIPLWLLRQYNPDVDFTELRTGNHLTIPKVRPR